MKSAAWFAVFVSLAAPAMADPGAAPTVVVVGGVDATLSPDLAKEFAIVPVGEQFVGASVSSPAAQEGFLQNDCTFGVLPNCSWSPLGPGSPVDFGVSLVPLTKAQVAAYNQGQGAGDGPPIQFPLYGLAVAIPVVNSAITTNGRLLLGDGELCGILSGQITDWSQFSVMAAPGPFKVVYDADPGSGMTWLLTQHLAAVCDATNSAFTQLPVPVTSDFTQLPVPGGISGDNHYISGVDGGGVQAALLSANSAIGYIGANYTSLLPHSPVTSTLVVAGYYNSAAAAVYTPSQGSAKLALNNPGPSAVNASPPASAGAAADPTRWVPIVPNPVMGYPIVGYANWILSTCYRVIAPQVLQYLSSPLNPKAHVSIAAAEGFVQLTDASPAYAGAVANILLSNQDGYNLEIQNPEACGGRAQGSPDE